MHKLTSLLFLTLLAFSCNRKTATVITPPAVEIQVEETTIETPAQVEVNPISTLPHSILSIKKTPCYGKCPVFEARFMSDGRVTWYGEEHTTRMGHYEAFVDSATLARLEQQITDSGYFGLQANYPADIDRMIGDLPQTITKVQLAGQIWQVINNHDAPNQLNDLERFAESELEKLVWRKIE